EQPAAGLHLRVPQPLAVALAEADDVVLGVGLVRCSLRPVGEGDEDAVADDDRAGLVVVEADLRGAVDQGRLPEDVRLLLPSPGDGQAIFARVAHPGRPPPAGPVFGAQGGPGEERGSREDRHAAGGKAGHGMAPRRCDAASSSGSCYRPCEPAGNAPAAEDTRRCYPRLLLDSRPTSTVPLAVAH